MTNGTSEWPKVIFEDDAAEYQEYMASSVRELTDVLFAWLAAKELLSVQDGFWVLWLAAYRMMGFIMKEAASGTKGEDPPEEVH